MGAFVFEPLKFYFYGLSLEINIVQVRKFCFLRKYLRLMF